MKRNLLYVDDEQGNLVVFRASFAKHFNILEASNASEAMDLFTDHDIPVLVADQRMPEMSGVELCEIIGREYPHTIRMILTGYIDSDAMMEAINKGHVYNFIAKPWERETLLSILLRGFEAHDLSISNNALLERIDHAEQCATLGRLAAGLAHEIRNQLFVLPLVELLETKYQDDEELMELATIARETQNRLNELVAEVMSFVRKDNQSIKKSPINLADVTRETLNLATMDKSIPRNRLKLDVRAEPTACCHKSKLQQVLFNLIKNAADVLCMKEDGEIIVTVDQSNKDALLSVRDNGPGIETENLDKIWEPFYSTKGADGNGLGLDICRRIIEDHSGTISCTSSPNQGALFTILLPLLDNTEVS